jgi:hypothetical protein
VKVGFVNIYSFRPHVEHLYYLSTLFQKEGHETYFLTCDAGVSSCYPRHLKKTSKIKECAKCMAGGIRSFPVRNVTSIKKSTDRISCDILDELSLSSSCTLSRTESELEWNEPEVVAIRESLHGPVNDVYHSAIRWIRDNSLDAVVCFNGRMELTRAVTYACEVLKKPYITHERTWFGDGIQLIPNANCLSLKAVGDMVAAFDEKPLKSHQAAIAAKIVGQRFRQKNSLEWRLYNKNPASVSWPLRSNKSRVLILPSSKNEFAGHDEWRTQWEDNTQALDDFMDAFGIGPDQVVLRCHPNWAEKIGQIPGDKSLSLYVSWARERGIYCIESSEKANTYDLIQEADYVVLNGGSSAVEAGACGKQVICLGPSTYQKASFVRTFLSRDELFSPKSQVMLDPEEVIRRTLRYIYVRSHRYPQFVNYVKAITTVKYEYFDGADPEVMLRMLDGDTLEPDDPEVATSTQEEDLALMLMKEKQWDKAAELSLDVESNKSSHKLDMIKRRFSMRWLDHVRNMMPRGDQG